MTTPTLFLVLSVGWGQFVWRFDDRVKRSASFHRRWSEIHSEAQRVWAQVDSLPEDERLAAHRKLEALHRDMDEDAAAIFSYDRKLAKKVFDEMLVANHLTPAT